MRTSQGHSTYVTLREDFTFTDLTTCLHEINNHPLCPISTIYDVFTS